MTNDLLIEAARKRAKNLVILLKRHGKVCWYCGSPFTSFNDVEVDHIIPVSRGGLHTLSNLAIACIPCNQGKGNLPLDEFLHWLRKPKSPIPYIHERAKSSEKQWLLFGDQIEKGLRLPTQRKKKKFPTTFVYPIRNTL